MWKWDWSDDDDDDEGHWDSTLLQAFASYKSGNCASVENRDGGGAGPESVRGVN